MEQADGFKDDEEKTPLDELLDYIEALKTVGSYAYCAGHGAAVDSIKAKLKAIHSRSLKRLYEGKEREDRTLCDPTSVPGNENIIEQ